MDKGKKGWIQKDGFNYYVVLDNSGTNLLAIDSIKFPQSLSITKAGFIALMVSNYLMDGWLPSDVPQEIETEIKLAIGDRG